MQCRLWSFVMCGAGLLGLAGCMTHNLETRLISSFIKNLEKSDIEELKSVASTDFKGSALRHEKAVEAFKMLNLPEGKVTVVDVKDKGPDEKRVLVKVGEKERKLYFDLILDPQSKKWVVHDVEFKKNLKPGQVNKSVTEQMDLLLSIQEFLDAWESGDRTQILASSTADLRKALEPLPPKSLQQLSTKITADLKRDTLKPEVEGHANMALVRLKRKSGETLVTMRLQDDKWVADDIAVQSKKEDGAIPSLRKHTQVMLTAIRFCAAYQSDNKTELARFSDPGFFRRILQSANLSQVPMPIKNAEEEDFDIKLLSTRAEVLVKRKEQVVHLSLTQGPPKLDIEGKPIESEAEIGRPFLVEEITFHEVSTNQDKRLSAILSSQSLVMVFAEALAQGDLKSLRIESTSDFQSRVWSRIELEDLSDLPLEQIESVPPVILDTVFKGPLTEVTVNQGKTPLTYVLRDQNGRLLVDDVLTPALDRPNSLKLNLEVQIPLRNFAKGLRTGDMRLVRDNASREFNKLVFQSMNRIPKMRSDPAPFLVPTVNRIQMNTERAVLELGDNHFGAKVSMNKEGDHYVIDDITMINGIEQSQRKRLKTSLRELVLSGTRFGNPVAKKPGVPLKLDDDEDSEPVVLSSDRTATLDIEMEPEVQSPGRIQRVGHTTSSPLVNPRKSTRSGQPERGIRQTVESQDDLDLNREPKSNLRHRGEGDLEDTEVELPKRRVPTVTRMVLEQPKAFNGRMLDSGDDDGTRPGYSGADSHEDDIDVIQPPKQ